MLHFTLSQLIRYYKKTYKTYEINHKKTIDDFINHVFHVKPSEIPYLIKWVVNKNIEHPNEKTAMIKSILSIKNLYSSFYTHDPSRFTYKSLKMISYFYYK